MTMSWQNLIDDGEITRYWWYGRAWFRRSGEWYKRRFGTLRVEWSLPCGHCGWGVTFGGGDSGQDFGITFAIPWLLSLYVTLENVFPMYFLGTNFDRGHDRNIGCYFFDWTFHYNIWVGSMASWSRTYPWCKWWRQHTFDFRNLLGPQTFSCVTLKENIPVVIPMPEGVYHGTAKIEKRRWKRTLWFPMVRVSTTIDCKSGIPFAGKGENSWDCGDDGLFGWGAEGPSIEKAVGHGVEIVLENRRRHGHASADAIQKALAYKSE